jgi:SAM-dependent methyltransferase
MRKNVSRLYKDLAWLWPIWEDVEVYREESELFAKLIKKYAKVSIRTLLDMGCGGGKNAFHLKRHFKVTGIDISRSMLSNAKKQNPDCKFHLADMRNFDLKQQFDSVFINDSITYMITKRDLLKTFLAAHKHLKAGGVMITHPDECKERFKQNETTIWTSKTDDMDITFIENQYDPNPKDDTFEKTLVYLIRKKGKLRIEQDFHVCGLFGLAVWRKLLKKVGFEVFEGEDKDLEDIPVYCCVKPL